MRLLLDTSTLAYWVLDSEQLSSIARDLIADIANEVWVSSVSAFEIANKHRIGKWADISGFLANLEREIGLNQFQSMPVTMTHALLAGTMPGEHRDPFDRLLAAQAQLEGMTLVTNDPKFSEFGSQTAW